MNREQLAHLVRAASRITGDGDILILGSQAVLGTPDASDLPQEATLSMEADLAFTDDADANKADQVDGAIGELSTFHETYGYYAQGVSISTAVLPVGWKDGSFTSTAMTPSPGIRDASKSTTWLSPSWSLDERRISPSPQHSSLPGLSTRSPWRSGPPPLIGPAPR